MVQCSRPRVAIAGLLCGVVATLGWLLFVIGGNRAGMVALPDGDARATVMTLGDASGRWTIDDVHGREASDWSVWDGRDYIMAPNGSATWIKVALANDSDAAWQGVLVDSEYFTDRVDFWEAEESPPAEWRHHVAGEAIASGEKLLGGRLPAFTVELPAGGEKTFYLRIEDRFVAASRVVWWPRVGDFLSVQLRCVFAESVCYGVLVALLLYHAILWVRLRHADIAWYVLGACALVTFNFLLNGGPAVLGWTLGSPIKETLGTLALGLHGVFLVLFAREFLELGTRFPRANAWSKGLMAVGVTVALGALATPWMRTTEWLHLAVPAGSVVQLSLLVIATMAWRRGASHARFFILASGAMVACTLPAVFNWLAKDTRHGGAMGVLGGSALEILLLSLAVADRFSQAQREKGEAQRRLIEEAERVRAVQEAYADELEVEVRERTRELETANADKDRIIMVLGHDLRGPLTGLTRAAEQAATEPSPWALVHFAQDAASTGRNLLLMIEDLVLWARLKAGSRQVTECSVHMLVAPAAGLHRNAARHGGVQLEMDVPEELRVETDLVLVQTLVRNLVDNAVKHARSTVAIVAREEGAQVRLKVRDDGPGLPADAVAWLTQTGEVEPSGHGLGLRLCREIACALDFRLEARPGPNGGAEFSFVLSRARVAI